MNERKKQTKTSDQRTERVRERNLARKTGGEGRNRIWWKAGQGNGEEKRTNGVKNRGDRVTGLQAGSN